jgi:hypothetical protein
MVDTGIQCRDTVGHTWYDDLSLSWHFEQFLPYAHATMQQGRRLQSRNLEEEGPSRLICLAIQSSPATAPLKIIIGVCFVGLRTG